MKILLFTDVHMHPRSSIINRWGDKYPSRLENCIKSINWLERIAEEQNCDYVINLGDFFDRPDLTSETITACNEIEWSNVMHYSIVGNHDASSSSLIFNSVNRLSNSNHKVITEPSVLPLEDCFICFLPYVVECDRRPLNEYFQHLVDSNKPVVILSHNDISGIQMGPVISKTGFSIEEIEANCSCFINGHLHNGQALSSKVINLGNLTGKDFGEDAFKYKHNIAILDTKTLQIELIENPYAYNFYKIQIDTAADLDILDTLKQNAAVSVKCDAGLAEAVKQRIMSLKDTIIESRIVLIQKYEETSINQPELNLSVDHLARFVDCCRATIASTELLEDELSQICK